MTKLTVKEIFRLGFAYGSFSVGEIDQGIHLVLPVSDADGVRENDVFATLFEKYFDRIPEDTTEDVCEVYMGAVGAYLADYQLDLLSKGSSFIKVYKRAVSGKST